MEEREIALVETKKFTILIAVNHAHFSSRFAGFFLKAVAWIEYRVTISSFLLIRSTFLHGKRLCC